MKGHEGRKKREKDDKCEVRNQREGKEEVKAGRTEVRNKREVEGKKREERR